jgi:hypothetical protein
MLPEQFVQVLQDASFENVFNPYSDRCERYDTEDAPEKRRKGLLALLTAAGEVSVDSLWLGRDLGHRGGRRTGLALTDDVHVADHAARWGVGIERATSGPMMAERTAAEIWKVIVQISDPIFLWNVFPFHPYKRHQPLTNRPHNSKEKKAGEELLSELICMLKPRRLIAIGNDAADTAARLLDRRRIIHVRHPSYGGQRAFQAQIETLYVSNASGYAPRPNAERPKSIKL